MILIAPIILFFVYLALNLGDKSVKIYRKFDLLDEHEFIKYPWGVSLKKMKEDLMHSAGNKELAAKLKREIYRRRLSYVVLILMFVFVILNWF